MMYDFFSSYKSIMGGLAIKSCGYGLTYGPCGVLAFLKKKECSIFIIIFCYRMHFVLVE